MEEKPQYLRETESRGKTNEQRSSWLHEGCEVFRRLRKVCNAIESGKVGKGSVEQRGGLKLAYTLGREQAQMNGGLWSFALQPSPGSLDHPFGGIAGNDRDCVASKKEGVFASAAVKFNDRVAGVKGLSEYRPHRVPLGAPDQRSCEQVVIALCQFVEGEDGLWLSCRVGGQASTSMREESRPARAA